MKVALPEWYRPFVEEHLDGAQPGWYSDVDTALKQLRDSEGLWLELWGHRYRDADILAAAPKLNWVQTSAAGVERLDLEAFRRRRIALTNGAGLHAPPIAEHVVMCMLAARRGLLGILNAQREGRWDRGAGGNREIAGSNVLILGYGLIGKAIAQKARALGANVTGIRRREQPDWRDLLPDADFLVVAAPLTPATRGIVGAKELKALKQGAWVINIARGPLIDEEALVRALTTGPLGGAALDVFDHEPLPEGHPLWSMPNVILSPHVSASTDAMFQRAADLFLDNLRRFRDGRPLRNRVNFRAGY